MPTNLKYKYTIFYHFKLRSGPGFFSADPDRRKKCWILIPDLN